MWGSSCPSAWLNILPPSVGSPTARDCAGSSQGERHGSWSTATTRSLIYPQSLNPPLKTCMILFFSFLFHPLFLLSSGVSWHWLPYRTSISIEWSSVRKPTLLWLFFFVEACKCLTCSWIFNCHQPGRVIPSWFDRLGCVCMQHARLNQRLICAGCLKQLKVLNRLGPQSTMWKRREKGFAIRRTSEEPRNRAQSP